MSGSVPPRDYPMIQAAVSLAFFGLLRGSEFTSPRIGGWDPSVGLGRTDVIFVRRPPSMVIRIKASKTDPFRLGCSLRLVSLRVPVCSVQAMRAYLRLPRRVGGWGG